MIPLSSAHAHTTYCDGRETPEQMVEAAIEKGLVALGFSGHSYTQFDQRYCMSERGTLDYIEEVNALKQKYRGKIEILLGLEHDVYSKVDTSPYDYRIGSLHYIDMGKEYLPVDESPQIMQDVVHRYFGGDYYLYSKIYYEQLSTINTMIQPDIYGHIDLVTKFNKGNLYFDEEDRRYQNAALECVTYLLESDKPFELNTGAVFNGYRSRPYPGPVLLKHICNRGGRMIITSDAHVKEALCYRFQEACAVLKCIGFREVWTMREQGLVPEPL